MKTHNRLEVAVSEVSDINTSTDQLLIVDAAALLHSETSLAVTKIERT
jgi:hypothetical protein